MTGAVAQTVATRTAEGPRVLAVVRGWSLHMPGAAPAIERADGRTHLIDRGEPAAPADVAATLLGRKGLLFKEPATRLALCAAHTALGLAPKERLTGPARSDTGVVVASNLGNVETVADVIRTVHTAGGRDVSPLAAPNASSNVIASTLAIWFRCAGANLMLCSGATAGLDAVIAAVRLLRAGRCARVLVVGVEPDDPVAAAWRGARLRTAAACVVLAAAPSSAVDDVVLVDDAEPDLVIGPTGLDPAQRWGDSYGAQGLVNLALACAATRTAHPSVAVECGDGVDGWRRVTVARGGAA